MQLSVVERLKITPIYEKRFFHLFFVVFVLILSDAAKPASITMPSKMCKYSYFNRSGIWTNRNLPSFSVGSVRAGSVFSVESAEFGSAANNDVTF